MLSIERCKTVLKETGKGLSNHELHELRDLLYSVAKLAIDSGLLKM